MKYEDPKMKRDKDSNSINHVTQLLSVAVFFLQIFPFVDKILEFTEMIRNKALSFLFSRAAENFGVCMAF